MFCFLRLWASPAKPTKKNVYYGFIVYKFYFLSTFVDALNETCAEMTFTKKETKLKVIEYFPLLLRLFHIFAFFFGFYFIYSRAHQSYQCR